MPGLRPTKEDVMTVLVQPWRFASYAGWLTFVLPALARERIKR